MFTCRVIFLDNLSHRAARLVSAGQEVMHADDTIQEGLDLGDFRADDDRDDKLEQRCFTSTTLRVDSLGGSPKVASVMTRTLART